MGWDIHRWADSPALEAKASLGFGQVPKFWDATNNNAICDAYY